MILNLIAITTIAVLNARRKKVVIPIVKAYTIVDTVKFIRERPSRRRTQFLVHHFATLHLLRRSKSYPQLIHKVLDLENSTAAIMWSRAMRWPIMKPVSGAIWFYYRILYFPQLLREAGQQPYDVMVSAEILKALGVMWTLERIK